MAFALHARGIVKAIMPVIVNEQADGTHHESFFQARMGDTFYIC
jgi:hypothetical protein